MRGLFNTATAVFQVAFYKKVQCSESDAYSDERNTIFNDPIHGHIELPEICVKIINTPEFLRLRHIKQLGATYEVFPGAAHNRFEHCLGVCHLAGTFGKHLKQQIDEELEKKTSEKKPSDLTEEMRITKDDIICLQIAGLCHDLGHGPMSHAFESHFIHKLNPFSKWKHEKGSKMMFDYLVNKNNIPIKSKEDREFIKQLIHRDPGKHETGRPKEKDFLYEVVSNKENGIDVDKWDYFARDSYHLGFRNNFDHSRLIKFSRVIKVKEEGKENWHICYRDKQVEDIYHMYMSRVILHRRACQHKTVQIRERMYMEALEKADEHYWIKTSDGKNWKISDSIKDAEAYSKLTDNVFHDIRNSSDEEALKEAKDILKRLDTRKHYKLVSEALPKRDEEYGLKLSYEGVRCDEEKILNEIVERSRYNLEPKQEKVIRKVIESSKGNLQQEERQILEEIVRSSNGKLKQEDLLVDIAIFDYGKKDKNPVDKVYFYNKPRKDQTYKAFHMTRDDISHLLPDVYSEHHIRLYIKKVDDEMLLKEARKCFRAWCERPDRKMDGKWKFQDPPTDE